METQRCLGVWDGKVGGLWGNGITSLFGGRDGKVGGSIEGWEHRAVLGFGMGRLGVSMKEWENIIIVG